MDFKKAQTFWDRKDIDAKKMNEEDLKKRIGQFLLKTSTLALGTSDYQGNNRVTPLEFTYKDGALYILTEGGHKFDNLEVNLKVSFAIFGNYAGFNGGLHSLQGEGKCEILDPSSKEYADLLTYKKIPLAMINKLKEPMYCLKIIPEEYVLLDSDLKKEGYDSRQKLSPVH